MGSMTNEELNITLYNLRSGNHAPSLTLNQDNVNWLIYMIEEIIELRAKIN